MKKVVVAMSGGIDSSVTALLLKEAGFKVSGIFMRVINDKTAEIRAKKAAKKLNIPLKVVDLKKEFKKRVISYFLKVYKEGRTPNTCVNCNKEIKFNLLKAAALKTGADFFATGHYVQLKDKRLLKAKDKTRDQSYFLWRLGQKQLKNVFFPLGDYLKEEVRVIAKQYDLPALNYAESRENCFIFQRKTSSLIKDTNRKFLKKYLKQKPGLIVDENNKVLGKHEGIAFYTIGQRKGLEISGGPYYVLEINAKRNIVVVTNKEKLLDKKVLIARNINWVFDKPPTPLKIKAQIRYGHKAVPATIYKMKNTKYRVEFNRAQRAITPGQSVVFYLGRQLLGGGVIC